MELVAALVNETDRDALNRDVACSGLRLAKQSANRTFDLSTGRIYVNPGQAVNLDFDILGFNATTFTLRRWVDRFGTIRKILCEGSHSTYATVIEKSKIWTVQKMTLRKIVHLKNWRKIRKAEKMERQFSNQKDGVFF